MSELPGLAAPRSLVLCVSRLRDYSDITCINTFDYSRDCPIFYMRTKVQKDLKDARKALERFDISW